MITADEQIFRLQTNATSYWFQITPFGHLEQIYYGPKLEIQPIDGLTLKRTAMIGSTVAYDQQDLHYSLDTIPLVFSGCGYGDYRFSPAEIIMPDGSFSHDFLYVSHKVVKGYLPIPDLPSSYGDETDCETLIITLKDEATAVRLELFFTVYEKTDVITRRVAIHNDDDQPIILRRLMSLMLDLPHRNFKIVTFDGGWIKEAHRHDSPITYGMKSISSTTGGSSNRHNPGFLVAEAHATEESGYVYGFNLVYSGNHFGGVELSNHDIARVVCGMNPHCFQWELKKDTSFYTPEAIMTFSDKGFNGVSHQFHDFINHHIVRGDWKNKARPVLLNNWEAHFFKFNQSKLLQLAKEGKEIGVELFVLDDGWFKGRDHDQAGLGDYEVNQKKLPQGIAGFSKKIKAMGLDFGLWFEPEMVNIDSDLYQFHPTFAIDSPHRKTTLGRNQLVLDLTQVQVQDYIIENVGKILDESDISYVKWDMNRHISDTYSPHLAHQGEFFHRYILGLYRILGEIFHKRPHILLESCSSGGNRFDLGMLCYSPQIWSSDDTDPVERLKIQGGLSYLYPPSTMGAHVSSSPHQQTLRETPLSTRFNVAAFGLLGYELNLKYLSKLEKNELKEQIAFYKEHRELLQYGTFSRLDATKDNKVLWQTVDRDKKAAISGFFQTLATASEGYDHLRVLGLDPQKFYSLQTKPQNLYVKRFGELVKHIMPVELDPNGFALRCANKFYKLNDAVETYEADGKLLSHGVMLNNQFIGSHYNENTRLLGDFGSSLYVIKEIKK